MKKILLTMMLITIIIIAFGVVGVSAKTIASGTCGHDLIWTLNDNWILTITGQGDMDNWDYYNYSELFAAREYIVTVVIEDGVTSIGDWVFYNFSSLAYITIPDSITRIGNTAFYGCNNLKKVQITDFEAWCNIDFDSYYSNPLSCGGGLYLNSNLLTDITISNRVTNIGNFAFAGYRDLVSITLPNNVISIGNSAFAYCSGLINITIPDSVTSIGGSAFNNCSSLVSITLPNNVISIGNSTFAYCSGLINITIPDSVTSIGGFAFKNCSSLTNVYYNSTEENWSKISIGDYNEPLKNATIHYIQEQYQINEITIKDMSENDLESIPTGKFLATVSFPNVNTNEDTIIILALYTSTGKFKGLIYTPLGTTDEHTFPVDNSNGDVTELKAFCWESFGSMTPLGSSVSFPAQ